MGKKVAKKVTTAKRSAPKKKTTKKPLKKPKIAPKKAVKKPASKPKAAAKAKRVAKAPKAPKETGPKGYTAAQYITYKAAVKKFNDWNNQKMKDLLRKNAQSMSGNKDELIFKCADGETLGKIPRCTACFGGR